MASERQKPTRPSSDGPGGGIKRRDTGSTLSDLAGTSSKKEQPAGQPKPVPLPGGERPKRPSGARPPTRPSAGARTEVVGRRRPTGARAPAPGARSDSVSQPRRPRRTTGRAAVQQPGSTQKPAAKQAPSAKPARKPSPAPQDKLTGAALDKLQRVMAWSKRPLFIKSQGGGRPRPDMKELRAACQRVAAAQADAMGQTDQMGRDLKQLDEELWNRGIFIATRLILLDKSPEIIRGALGEVLQGMMLGQRWEMLSRACRTITETLELAPWKKEDEDLKKILSHLHVHGRLRDLAPQLMACNPQHLAHLTEVLDLLPREANTDLVYLLEQLPDGDKRDHLDALLRQRGVDMSVVRPAHRPTMTDDDDTFETDLDQEGGQDKEDQEGEQDNAGGDLQGLTETSGDDHDKVHVSEGAVSSVLDDNVFDEQAKVSERAGHDREAMEDPEDELQLEQSWDTNQEVEEMSRPAKADDGVRRLSGEEAQAAVKDVSDLLSAVDKAVKMYNFYEGKGKNVDLTVGLAYGKLETVGEAHGAVPIRIAPYELILGEDTVWEAEEEKKGLSFTLFKDGLRELTLLPGMEREEFMQFLNIVRGSQPGKEGDDNTVTRLWESNPACIRFRAIDLFQEGISDTDMGTSSGENIHDVVQHVKKPLHDERKASKLGQQSPDADTFASRREQALAHLETVDRSAFFEGLKEHFSEIRSQFWRRAIHVASMMIQMDTGAHLVAELLSQVLEEMLLGGKWEMLADTCRTIGATMKPDGGDDDDKMKAGLALVLADLCMGHKLRGLQSELAGCTVEDFDHLTELLRLLPDTADQDLIHLLVNQAPGAIFDKLKEQLTERGVDLTDLYVRNLEAKNQDKVLSAIEELKAIGSQQAMAAIPRVLSHGSARIRLEALKALVEKLGENTLPDEALADVIPSLGSGYLELQDLCFTLVEDIKRCSHGPQLLKIIKDDTIKWQKEPKKKALVLLIRWGGAGVDEWLEETMLAKKLFGGGALEKARKEVLAALITVGGDRGREVLFACKRRGASGAILKKIEETLKKIR